MFRHNRRWCRLIIRCIVFSCHIVFTIQSTRTVIFTGDDIYHLVDTSCFVAFSGNDSSLSSVFEDILFAYRNEKDVVIGYADFFRSSDWITKNQIKIKGDLNDSSFGTVVFPRRKNDRSCLSTGSFKKPTVYGVAYDGPKMVSSIIDFINDKCVSYQQKNSYLTVEGLHRAEILHSLFHVENVSSIRMRDLQHFCLSQFCRDIVTVHEHSSLYQQESNTKKHQNDKPENGLSVHNCDRIELPTKAEFFHEYLKLSKPVIIKNAMSKWPALKKWSNSYFKSKYGNKMVHIKLTPHGIFEGVDVAAEFENYENFHIPHDVKKQLLFPDLVVVRPATQNMNFSEFIDLIEAVSVGNNTGTSAYLEYSSLSDIVDELENDVLDMPFFDNMLKLEHRNIWLSDGKTLGKLHFDPFDNFLCQISGKKEVILFSPHDNTKLYEAHIPEALLEYDTEKHVFVKKTLVASTSMVMSPVDITNPNYERFPKFAHASPMNCTIEEGEVLFLPAFWWHEVQSYPSTTEKRNLAVNFWYDPFLTKEFPCQDCKLDINPKYRHLL